MKDMENRQMSSDWGVITAFAGIICLQTVCELDESAENLTFVPLSRESLRQTSRLDCPHYNCYIHATNFFVCEILPSSAYSHL